jgi:uncharacterized protein
MFTRKAVIKIIRDFVLDLKQHGYNPTKVILFGSYAKGTPHTHSDIDLAIWDHSFTGARPIDVENIIKKKIKRPPLLELHTFHSSDTPETDPFIGEILNHGIPIDIN